MLFLSFIHPGPKQRERERDPSPPPFLQLTLLEFSFLPGWRNFWRSKHGIKTGTGGWVGARPLKRDEQTDCRGKKTVN